MAEFLTTIDKRKILHVDLDAFYAQIEMRDQPELRSKPLIIARDPTQNNGHGVVATANYAARQLGIHSAMSAFEAKRLAPNGIFLSPNFTKYKVVSAQIHDIFRRFTNKVEPVAFDEAYLDVTANVLSGATLAAEIRHQILKETHLTSSIGVSHNKLLAKLGSEYNKPNGVTVINQENQLQFLDCLSISAFRGVGKKTKEKFDKLGITNGLELRQMSREELKTEFGKMGEHFYWQARGVHFGAVEWQRQRQSVGKEETFDRALRETNAVQIEFKKLVNSLVVSMNRQKIVGRTLNIKIRDEQFNTITRAITRDDPWALNEATLVIAAQTMFDDNIGPDFSVRLLGVSMSNLQSATFEEMSLF
ncbi:DNA polymerase IV [Leuconostoc falkenbergense]|uniref:DNA polymerase IV n=1 Tax=Leuconostoc falkenbergense TaxID=2766470 RepID=UPI0024AC9825|nr:DNA polymerase IV [Leuconostoc falkenbergense]MDI6667636.1 DNA polymerase IV [Leuconostoc falkenbergense]